MVFKKELYIKRLVQREFLENILVVIDRFKNISDLKECLQRMLVEIEEELRAYTMENDPIYSHLVQGSLLAEMKKNGQSKKNHHTEEY